MPGSYSRQRPVQAPTVPRRTSLPSALPSASQNPLLAAQQAVGNHAVGRLLAPAALPSRRTVEDRLSGGRTFGRSSAQRRILKWVDRWHGGIAAATPGIRLAFLERLRALVVQYKAAKELKTATDVRTAQTGGLQTLIDEIDAVRLATHTEYRATDDLPDLTQLDAPVWGDELSQYNPDGVEPLGHGFLNQTYKATVDAQGTEMVLKEEKTRDRMYGNHRGTPAGIPEYNPNQTGRAVATRRIAQLMGIAHVVPHTYYGNFNGALVQLMELIDGEEAVTSVPGGDGSISRWAPIHATDRNLIYWLDLVCGQVDRHGGNFMLGEDQNGMTGEVFAIDNDLAFGQNYGIHAKKGTSRNVANDRSLSINGKEANALWITPVLAERIIRLARNPTLVAAALNGLVTAAEINATTARLTNLAIYLVRRLGKRDRITGWS
ncbi:MAG: hypothetical protein R3F65_19400 [bacterium]